MKIDWKQKLSSRKFWLAVAGLLSAVLTAFRVDGSAIAQALSVVAGIGGLCVYMLVEGKADTARAAKPPVAKPPIDDAASQG